MLVPFVLAFISWYVQFVFCAFGMADDCAPLPLVLHLFVTVSSFIASLFGFLFEKVISGWITLVFEMAVGFVVGISIYKIVLRIKKS